MGADQLEGAAFKGKVTQDEMGNVVNFAIVIDDHQFPRVFVGKRSCWQILGFVKNIGSFVIF